MTNASDGVTTAIDRELLLLPEAADLARVSVETVRHWLKGGKLRSVRPGRRRLIRRRDLEVFLGLRAEARDQAQATR